MRSLLLALLAASGCGEVAKLQTDAKVPMCGDSVVDPGEDCDSGGENSASCNDDCTIARCGDMKINEAAGEQCEGNDASSCTSSCKLTTTFASTGAEGAFAPTEDTVLPGGVHHFTTISIPEGVTVTVANGVADLRATGAVTINGRIDVSGGHGADGVMTANYETEGGGGGATGIPQDGASATAGCPVQSIGGFGAPGGDSILISGQCISKGGGFGGGNGGGRCNGGAGGGGFAGGGGGAGYSTGTGGPGASAFGGVGGAGGVANSTTDGIGKTAGAGGRAPGRYTGRDGTYSQPSCGGNYPGTSGGGGSIGALAASDLSVSTTFQPGSGGGGGGGQCLPGNYGAGGGGGGGGAIRIASPVSITIGPMAEILANGGTGGDGATGAPGIGAGGGGSGGVIYLAAPALDVQAGAKISAMGAPGGVSTPLACGRGGEGGYGRIRISATQTTCKLDGAFTPPLNAAACAPANVPEKVYVAPYPN